MHETIGQDGAEDDSAISAKATLDGDIAVLHLLKAFAEIRNAGEMTEATADNLRMDLTFWAQDDANSQGTS